MHVLLIEPDRMLAEIYRSSLVRAGHTVTPCSSAQAGVLAADQHCPDAVVLELQLIEHSGIEFLYEFRSYKEWQDIPVIVHSQVPSHEFAGNWQMLMQQLTITKYLYKPHASLQNLVAAVNDFAPAVA
ncbi:MAG: response regulator [Patescibacteria group bacterium]|nr:response regulator [Patescibacteria group bacterium]